MYKTVSFGLIVLIVFGIAYYVQVSAVDSIKRPRITQLSQIYDLFPSSKASIGRLVEKSLERISALLESIYVVEDSKRTFDNTLVALDKAAEEFQIAQASLYSLSVTSPDEEVRKAAQEGLVKLQAYAVDNFTLNQQLYDAVLAYQNSLAQEQHEKLSPVREYFLKETIDEFKRSGLQLPKEQQEKVKKLNKEIARLSLQYDTALAASQKSIEVTKDGLKGLEQSFIDSLGKTDDGKYILTTNYAHFFKVMQQADAEDTRKRLFHAMVQRAYPENEKTLKHIIELRDEFAQLLGYKSYAELGLQDQMVKTPNRAEEFLKTLSQKAFEKAKSDQEHFANDLPPGVELKEGKIKSWDGAYVKNYHKKKYYNVDEALLAEYFPLDKTLPALLKVYEAFFGLRFDKIKKLYLWHEDIQGYAVYKRGQYLGTILLDLFSRPHKFSHAGQMTVVPTVKEPSGKVLPGVVVLLANFPSAQADRPALLKRNDVITFFHEFGHALHALLGSTELASQSGTAVKNDFVEMPSQMLEQWLWDPEILKAVSSHYKTGEPLPDKLINNIVSLKHFDAADGLMRQIGLAKVALTYYAPGAQKDIAALWKRIDKETRPYVSFDPKNKHYCSFTHITGYGPRYYGYLWSKVFALDLFSLIKQQGLRNPEIGARYIREVLSKGGSKDPNELLEAFLGRKPTTDAFFKDLGL